MLLLQQMIVLFIYMLIGYIACKKDMLDATAGQKLSWIVVNVANPSLIISSAINEEGKITGDTLLLTVAIAIAMYILLLLLAKIIPWIFKVPHKDYGIYKVMSVFNNIGFMGFPVIAAVYGKSALLYGAVFMIPYNVLIYTYGIQILKGANGEKETFQIKKILNIGVLACVLAAVLYISRFPVPQFAKAVTEGLSNLTGPLSMIVIGISMTKIPLRELFTDIRLLIFSAVKLLVIPILGMLIIKQFVTDEIICGVCMVMLATPVGSMTAMLAQQYGGDQETVTKGVSLTTILSVITIPVVSAIVL